MRLAELVAVSRSVAETAGRLEKIDRLAALLKRLEPGSRRFRSAASLSIFSRRPAVSATDRETATSSARRMAASYSIRPREKQPPSPLSARSQTVEQEPRRSGEH